MKLNKKLLTGVGGLGVIGLLLIMVAPKTAHAAVATLVQVTNTTAQPAITQSTAELASQLVHLNALATLSVTGSCGDNGGEVCPSFIQIDSTGHYANGLTPYTVPAGQNLVVTGLVATPFINIPGPFRVGLNANPLNTSGNYGVWQVASATASSEFHPTGIVVGPGISLNAEVTSFCGSGGSSCQVIVDLYGYLTAN